MIISVVRLEYYNCCWPTHYGFSLVRSDCVRRRQVVKIAWCLSTLPTSGTRFVNLLNHRKILSVDGKVAFVEGGEINLECYDTVMNTEMGRIMDSKLLHSTRVVLLTNEYFVSWLRNSVFRLFSPY